MNSIDDGRFNSVIQAQQGPHDSRALDFGCQDNPGDPTGKSKAEYIQYLAIQFFLKLPTQCEEILAKDTFVAGSTVTLNEDRSVDVKVTFTDGEEVKFSILPTVL